VISATQPFTGPGGYRVYSWHGVLYPSVTTVIRGGPQTAAPAGWAARAAAEYAVANLGRLARLPAAEATAEIEQAARARWGGTAGIGSLVHAAVEAHATGRPRPELPAEAVPLLAGFDRFLADHAPRFLLAEQAVYSRRHGYAGTLDFIAEIPGGQAVTLVDVKTGKNVYPQTALQLAAYAHADFAGAPDGTEHPLPAIQATAVLHLRPNGYQLIPVLSGPPVFDAFLAALALFRWTTGQAPAILAGEDDAEGRGPGTTHPISSEPASP
jgi:hypothetical protein